MYATPNVADNYTYVLFDSADRTNALTVAFVYNATLNSCQLNLAGSIRTAAIQSGNPNPPAAFFLFVDSFRLGDRDPTNGNYYTITCTTDSAGVSLSCFVTAFPDDNILAVQKGTSPQNYLAIVDTDASLTTHTPANVVLFRAT